MHTREKKTSAVDGNQVVSDLTIRIVTGSFFINYQLVHSPHEAKNDDNLAFE